MINATKPIFTRDGPKIIAVDKANYAIERFKANEYFIFGRFHLIKLMEYFAALPIVYLKNDPANEAVKLQKCGTFTLFNYQHQIIDFIASTYYTPEHVEKGSASCLLKLNTGLGKTFIAAELIARLQVRTIIVVLLVDLQNQMLADLTKVFPKARIRTNAASAADCDILILVINTAITHNREVYKHFGFAIFDEVPRFCTETFRTIFRLAKCTYSLGLSATPHRRDEMHNIALAHLGPIVAQEQFDIDDQEFDIKTFFKPYRAANPVAPAHNKTTKTLSFMESCRDCLSYDAARNEYIITLSQELLERGHRHFIFTLTITHAHALATMLAKLIDPEAIRTIAGGAKNSDKFYTLRNSSVIVGTYQGTSTGISVIEMTAAIFAMVPFDTSITQVYGRITRKNAHNPDMDKAPRIVYVIEDTAHYWLRSHYIAIRSRIKVKLDAEQKRYKEAFAHDPIDD